MLRTRRRAPFWLLLGLAVASALALRVLVGTVGGGDATPGQWAPPSAAFLGFLILIGELIWKGLEVAGKITIEILHWMVVNLSLLVVKIKNGLSALGSGLLQGLKRGWDFTRKLYDDVLKPAWSKFWRWFDKARLWLDRTFGPVLAWLKQLRDGLLLFYKTFIRPWLDLIDITRKGLRVLGSLGVEWARALDARLARVEELIEKPFRLVLAKINEVIGIVNRVVTADGLFQRVAFIKSLGRDYRYAWRAITQPYTRAVTQTDRDEATKALAVKSFAQIASETRDYMRDGGGPRAPLLSEMAIIWRKQLRES